MSFAVPPVSAQGFGTPKKPKTPSLLSQQNELIASTGGEGERIRKRIGQSGSPKSLLTGATRGQ